jgi:transmembrane protein DUF3556
MGFVQPAPPPFDLEEWKRKPFLTRLKPVVQDWAINGFGAPGLVYLLYVIKLVLFVFLPILIISLTTPGIGGLGDIGDWWTRPIVFQKAAVWVLLWEGLGLGSGSMPLAARYTPPIGGVLYRLRPGTVRLPAWPDKVPFTEGYRRTPFDVALYAGFLASAVYLLVSNGDTVGGVAGSRLEPWAILALFGFWGLLGLRDKVTFLSPRPEIYGFLLLVSLFPFHNFIVGWQFVFLFIWLGAASSKFNHHFPYVVAVMSSNTPWNRSQSEKKKMYVRYPDDLRPSQRAVRLSRLGTAWELGWPLVLIFSNGGVIGTIAVAAMVLFHVHITSTFALGVPMEWNLFMIFGLLVLFGHYGDVPLSTLDNPLLIALLVLIGILIPIIGNLRPEKISFLPSMRYYAGNWATSLWLFRTDTGAEEKLNRGVCPVAPIVIEQLRKMYDVDTADFLMEKGLGFRALHSHGRALIGLLARAVDDVDAYDVREGELVSGVVNGWNFGDGHFHHEQLLDAVQEQCRFAEGDVRVVVLESQPAHIQRQRYRIYDAASGLLEEGWVDVAEMRRRGPWLEESWEFPVEVTGGQTRTAEPVAAAE